MFRKPKKQISRRVFSGISDDEGEAEKMSVDIPSEPIVPKKKLANKEKSENPPKKSSSKMTLLSFGDDEEEEGGDVFQVKKSSHSKKVMKMLDRERRKKKKELESAQKTDKSNSSSNGTSKSWVNPETENHTIIKNEKSNKIQTEIRTDEFVLVVKNSQPDVVLNGRAALCAGKNDLSSEEEDEERVDNNHAFNKPDKFKLMLDSGGIPDAAMIHAARKRRQKAREQGEFIPLEDPNHHQEDPKKGKRLVHEADVEGGSDEDDDRIDMTAISGLKDLEERREKFYQAQQCATDDSDPEMREWENQQIRKGVTGAQLQSVQQESLFSNIILQSSFANSFNNYTKYGIEEDVSSKKLTTGELLKQAYEHSNVTKPKYSDSGQKQQQKMAPKTPQEILEKMKEKFESTRITYRNHFTDIDHISNEIACLKLELMDAQDGGPRAAEKYRFYQEEKCYMADLIECLDEKLPQISSLEDTSLLAFSKYSNNLIERRRQDVRDQAKDMAEASKPANLKQKPDPEDHARVRRTAEREGRRNRRRRDREKSNTNDVHHDGMSSDDEVNDLERKHHNDILESVRNDAEVLMEDAADDFAQINGILTKFEVWKEKYPETYNEAYIHLCLPKIIAPLIKLKLVLWNPLDQCEDFEKSSWYEDCMRYAILENETEESLVEDRDARLVPTLVEKIIIPKVNDFVEKVWDPMSTTQTFRLVQLMSKLGRDYPSLRPKAKSLRSLFQALLDKIKLSIENDVFIPIFPKQIQEGKSSFFQRQFHGGLKLFRNILSWQGIIADEPLKQLAILSLLNRYLLLGMRSSSVVDAVSKAHTILYTMPRVWLAPDSPILVSLEMFIALLRHINTQLDHANPMHIQAIENLRNIMKSLHVYE